MSSGKKLIRQRFRDAVFDRDGYKCRVCGWSIITAETPLDAHHITDRNLMPAGGYVKENGISLCPSCHLKAEHFHTTGVAKPRFSPDDLYAMIGSSYEDAVSAAKGLESESSKETLTTKDDTGASKPHQPVTGPEG